MNRSNLLLATLCLSAVCSTSAMAEESGFLTDYSKLSPGGDSGFTRVYIAPGAPDAIARFGSVMVDQPSFTISDDSKYKGLKPSDAVEVGEELRAAMTAGIGDSIAVVDEANEGAALMSWAVTNIRLKKKKRGLLGYTPVGVVAYGVKSSLSDVVDKSQAFDVVFEVEGTDSSTGEVLFAMTYDLTEEGIEAEWGDALALANGLGKRVGCRLNNARLAIEQRADCQGIPITSEER